MLRSITAQTQVVPSTFTGYAALVQFMVRFMTHAKTQDANKLAPVAALQTATEDRGITTAQEPCKVKVLLVLAVRPHARHVKRQECTGIILTKPVRHPEHRQAVRQQAGIGILSLRTAKIVAVPIVL